MPRSGLYINALTVRDICHVEPAEHAQSALWLRQLQLRGDNLATASVRERLCLSLTGGVPPEYTMPARRRR
jgi:hypothetical protein